MLSDEELINLGIIKWGSPIISFGNFKTSSVATIGINPSNREFVDKHGSELTVNNRRFHTLSSLKLANWQMANKNDMERISDTCTNYFTLNPYDTWFKALDKIIRGTRTSYYDREASACHLDLVPFATTEKWGRITRSNQILLVRKMGDILGTILSQSSINLIILNGKSVIENFESLIDTKLEKTEISSWSLPRNNGNHIKGFSYTGSVNIISGIELEKSIKIIGFNHNIQSSFGVTNKVINEISTWIGDNS